MKRADELGGMALAAPLFAAIATGGCGTLLGIGDLEAGPADAATDAPTAPDRDARTTPDHDAHTALDGDARTVADGGCHPVSVASAAPTDAAACGPMEAGACGPGQVSASSLKFVSPPAHMNVCTKAEVEDFYTACFNASSHSSSVACNAFQNDAGTAPCFGCIVSFAGASTYGAFVDYLTTNSGYVNTGACIAALDPCNIACAEMTQLKEQCLYAACASCTTLDQTNACTEQAGTCPCGVYDEATNVCWAALIAAASPAAGCLPINVETSLIAAATALCSGP